MKLRFILFLLSLLAFLSATAGGYFYYTSLRDAFFTTAKQAAVSHVDTINTLVSQHISDYTRLVDVMSNLNEIRAAVLDSNDETLGAANRILDQFQRETQMDVCYLMDASGQTIATSNRSEPDSFVGKNYSFRPYFQEAMSGRTGVYLAIGVTSGKGGIYFSHPVPGQNPDVPGGVAVIKASGEHIVGRLLHKGQPAHEIQKGMLLVVDPHGVIFASDSRELMLKTLWETDPIGQQKIAKTRQFGEGPWPWSGFERLDDAHVADASGRRFWMVHEEIPVLPGWRIVHLSNTDAISSAIANPLLKTVAFLIVGLCILIGAAIFFLNNLARAEIMERKRIEASLRESEERYRALVEESFDGIFVQKGPKIVFANIRLHQMLGYEDGGMVGMDHWRVYHPEFQDLTRERGQARMRGEKVPSHYEVKLIRKDGSWFYGEIAARVIHFEGEPGVQVWIKDIHERKQAEQALQESEQRMRAILRASPVGIGLVVDRELVWANETIYSLAGYMPGDLVGVKGKILYLDQQEYERVGRALYGDQMASGTVQVETQWVRKDGTVFDCMIRSCLLEASDPSKGHIVVVTDISEAKRLQAQLQRAQKMEAIGTLAGGVAHDLNNILSGLVSYPELLLMQIPGDSPLRKPILTIQRSGEKAAAVVQDLLTLARRGVSVREVVNLNDVVQQYLKSPEFERLKSFHPGVEVKAHLESGLLNMVGSPVHLSKTVMNLVSNAAEAVKETGDIILSTQNRYIDRPVRGYEDVLEGDYVVLVVRDPGVGISSEDIRKIFEPFYTKKKMGRSGTGLGMSVVWGTVKDHSGYIDVTSREGEGTTFTLYFPATRQARKTDAQPLSVQEYRGRGESILIVDDVAQQREIAQQMLKGLGYDVAAVPSGEEAVEYVRVHPVDLLILDMIMDPGIDGLETYRRISRFRPGQKAVITSGFSETERVREAQRLGAGAYIKKPFLSSKIGPIIRAELDK